MRDRTVGAATTRALVRLLRCYQLVVSPLLGPRCRHLPTCSDYAIEALGEHGLLAGGWMTLRRVARCHPFGTSGYDPVPSRRPAEREASRAAAE